MNKKVNTKTAAVTAGYSEKKKAGSKIDLKRMAEAVFTLIAFIAFYLVDSAIDSAERF